METNREMNLSAEAINLVRHLLIDHRERLIDNGNDARMLASLSTGEEFGLCDMLLDGYFSSCELSTATTLTND